MQFKPFEDKAFEAFVTKEYKKNPNEIFQVEYEGEKFWVKKGRKTSSNLFHHICYKLLPFEFLIPVENKTEKESILFETNKLMLFKAKGINVPEVIGSNERFFVMSDCGEQVYVCLRQKDIKEDDFNKYLNAYIKEVAKIHNAGFFHGGAQCRNFTSNDEKVFAIDLEDSFSNEVDIKTLQFRDLLLLLISMSKIDITAFSYQSIIDKYVAYTDNKEVISKLNQLPLKLQFLKKLNTVIWIHKKLPRDVKEFCNLLDALEKL